MPKLEVGLEVGQELVWPMGGGLKARMRVTKIGPVSPNGSFDGEMEMIEVVAPPRPRYVRGHPVTKLGFGYLCATCGEPIDLVKYSSHPPEGPIGYWRHSRRKQPQTARERRFCSSCGKTGEWYTFDSSGRCVECQP